MNKTYAYLSQGWFAMLASEAQVALAKSDCPNVNATLLERYRDWPTSWRSPDGAGPGFLIQFAGGHATVRPGAFPDETADVLMEMSWSAAHRIVSTPSGPQLDRVMGDLATIGDLVVQGDAAELPVDLFGFHDEVVARTFVPAAERRPGPSVASVLRADGDKPPACLYEQSPYQGGTGDIDKARFFDRDWHDREVGAVWRRVWQMACRVEEVAQPGDFIVYDIADISILVTHTEAGEIRAFHNSCLHRGTQLYSANASGSVGKFRCRYHGWTYRLDGELEDIPCRWDFPQFGAARHSLARVKTDTWGGFVFVNLDPNCGSLADYLGVLPAHFTAWPLEGRRIGAHVVKVIDCNWKVGIEAFLEGYHVAEVHPQALKFTGDINSQVDVWEPHISRQIAPLAVPSPRLAGIAVSDADVIKELSAFLPGDIGDANAAGTPRAVAAFALRTMLTGGTGVDHSAFSVSEIVDAVNYFVFPNLMPWAGYGSPIVYRLRPFGNDPDKAILDVYLLYVAPSEVAPGEPVATRYLKPGESWTSAPELGGLGAIFDQDEQNFGLIQRGLKSGGAPFIRPSAYLESRIRHLHATLDRYVGHSNTNPAGP